MLSLKELETVSSANEGVWIRIFHPVTLAETGIEIKVLGMDSSAYRQIIQKHQRKRAKAFERSGRLMSLSPEEMEDEQRELLVACTVDWKGVSEDGAEPLPFTPENARSVYESTPVIREQVNAAIADRALFIKA